MNKKKAITILSYLSFIFLGYIYTKTVLKKEEVSFYNDKEETEVENEYQVSIVLKLYQNGQIKEYKAKTSNLESIEEFLKDLRANQGLLYESTKYTYGTEITTVFGKAPDKGYKWSLIANSEDITNQMDNLEIGKNRSFEIKMTENQ